MGLFVMQVWGRGTSRYGAEDGCLLRDFGVCVYLDGICLYMCVWELVPVVRLEVREDVVCPALSHCLIPLKQGFSLNLERGWWIPYNAGVTGVHL